VTSCSGAGTSSDVTTSVRSHVCVAGAADVAGQAARPGYGPAEEMIAFRRTDYERMAGIYDSGRALPLEWLDGWRRELSVYLPPPGRTVLDVGAGTGLWAEAFAVWFDVAIVGIEPSEAMRCEAAAKGLRPRATFVGGRAEQIPLRKDSCDLAWLSTVVHHIDDLPACAAELRRVLRLGGRVLIRNSFGDRLEGIHWLDFFPGARDVASRRWPTVATTVAAFQTAEFQLETLTSVPEIVAPDLRAYHKRMGVRANSTLTLISDDNFREGLARLDEAAEQQRAPKKVVDRRDLLVLR
jgi:ubiquinone/menaquinone biosynthesis C-methylase UbiE